MNKNKENTFKIFYDIFGVGNKFHKLKIKYVYNNICKITRTTPPDINFGDDSTINVYFVNHDSEFNYEEQS